MTLKSESSSIFSSDANYFLIFGSAKCIALLKEAFFGEGPFLRLQTRVPDFVSTQSLDPTVRVRLRVEDNGQLLHELDVGNFIYDDGDAVHRQSSLGWVP